MRYLEIAGWKKNSCDDGPGIRSVLFLQGCCMNCPGCHNKDIQKKGEGLLVEVSDVLSAIISNCHNKRITISGGEPLEQWENLEELLVRLKELEFDVCIYTGWAYKDIPPRVFQLVNYIKTGGFVIEKKDSNIHYVGSSNQQMYGLVSNGNWERIDLRIGD